MPLAQARYPGGNSAGGFPGPICLQAICSPVLVEWTWAGSVRPVCARLAIFAWVEAVRWTGFTYDCIIIQSLCKDAALS